MLATSSSRGITLRFLRNFKGDSGCCLLHLAKDKPGICFLPSGRCSFGQLPCHFIHAEQRHLRNTSSLWKIPYVSFSLDFLQGQRVGLSEHNGMLGRCFLARYMSNTTIEIRADDVDDVVRFSFNKADGRNVPTRKEKKMKRRKMSRKAKLNELRFYRLKAKKKMNSPNPEVRIRYKLEKAKRKEEWLIEKLRKYEVPKASAEPYDPEILTEEESHYLKRTGEKRKNFVLVGRRGVFGGVVLNMHLHWKKHETVKVICKPCKPGQIHVYAEELARLSKGIVIDIKPNNMIIFYRGKNYVRPEVMSPPDTLSKDKALEKYRYEQSLEHTSEFIEKLEKELEEYQKHVARYKKKKEEEEESAKKKEEDAVSGFRR
ncbi:PREDICTED: uncharacterized CRM domain-containing protein At3g25440, chloroplastic [Tarenaya hassleriana]|uniref:uncharacterized CRM domain-containing protein At3g25440, chloroplastic n=1 Tax=Tarenaya hassleriana TaxID=28532 RepID=UPI00053C3D9D|nr:PREDICTED: uncharacterized CRM domain-containing protein At3g25440, chloroplastic [Tarenaya hassleriana]